MFDFLKFLFIQLVILISEHKLALTIAFLLLTLLIALAIPDQMVIAGPVGGGTACSTC